MSLDFISNLKGKYTQFCGKLSNFVQKTDTKTRDLLLLSSRQSANFGKLENMNIRCEQTLASDPSFARYQVNEMERSEMMIGVKGSQAIASLEEAYLKEKKFHAIFPFIDALQDLAKVVEPNYNDSKLDSAIVQEHQEKMLLCETVAKELGDLKASYHSLQNALNPMPEHPPVINVPVNATQPAPTVTAEPTSSQSPFYLGGYSALTSGLTRFLGDYLKSKKYTQPTTILATQATQLAIHLSTSPDPKLTLAMAVPNIAAQLTGVSKTKILVASATAYAGYMAYLCYYNPEACLTTSLNTISSLAGSLLGDLAGQVAYQGFYGSQYPAKRTGRAEPVKLRPRNEQGRAITESTKKKHVINTRI